MSKIFSKQHLKWIIPVVVVVLGGFFGFRYWQSRKTALPEGIVSGNGRLEATLVDVAAKEPLRVLEVLVHEGDLVKPGQVVLRLDTSTQEAQLAEANAAIAAAEERVVYAEASIVKQKSSIELARVEVERARNLTSKGAGSQRDLDVRRTALQTTTAGLAEVEASLQTARRQIDEARAKASVVQSRIDDATLKSPVIGRVLYRLAEAGEVLAPGGKALTLVNLEDIYMEIFVPSEYAAAMKLGAEGRITVDHDPTRAVAGFVSFVSPEAQFTPKQVETRSERELLMFRVKIQLPKELASQYTEQIKTGVRGVGYVKIDDHAVWPERLQHLVGSSPPQSSLQHQRQKETRP